MLPRRRDKIRHPEAAANETQPRRHGGPPEDGHGIVGSGSYPGRSHPAVRSLDAHGTAMASRPRRQWQAGLEASPIGTATQGPAIPPRGFGQIPRRRRAGPRLHQRSLDTSADCRRPRTTDQVARPLRVSLTGADATELVCPKAREARHPAGQGGHRSMEAPHLAGFRKRAEAEGRTIVFIDESGLSDRPTMVRTWAPLGQTPQLEFSFRWNHVSVIAGVT